LQILLEVIKLKIMEQEGGREEKREVIDKRSGIPIILFLILVASVIVIITTTTISVNTSFVLSQSGGECNPE
jgi:hypothetical protein